MKTLYETDDIRVIRPDSKDANSIIVESKHNDTAVHIGDCSVHIFSFSENPKPQMNTTQVSDRRMTSVHLGIENWLTTPLGKYKTKELKEPAFVPLEEGEAEQLKGVEVQRKRMKALQDRERATVD